MKTDFAILLVSLVLAIINLWFKNRIILGFVFGINFSYLVRKLFYDL